MRGNLGDGGGGDIHLHLGDVGLALQRSAAHADEAAGRHQAASSGGSRGGHISGDVLAAGTPGIRGQFRHLWSSKTRWQRRRGSSAGCREGGKGGNE